MFAMIVGMLLSVVIAVAVVALVAVPAHREGREVLTPKGDDVVSRVREITGAAVETARGRGGETADAEDDRARDVASSRKG